MKAKTPNKTATETSAFDVFCAEAEVEVLEDKFTVDYHFLNDSVEELSEWIPKPINEYEGVRILFASANYSMLRLYEEFDACMELLRKALNEIKRKR